MSNRLTAVTDSGGNTWIKIRSFGMSGHNSDGEMWYAIGVNPVTTVTATAAKNTTMAIEVHEFSGLDASSPVDVYDGASYTGTIADSGPATPTGSTDVAVGFIAGHASTQPITITVGGYTTQAQQTSRNSVSLVTGYQVLTLSATQHFTGTFSAAMYWASGVTLFKAAPSTPGPSPSPSPLPSPSPSPSPSALPSPSPSPSPSALPSPSPSPSPSPAPGGSCNLTTPIRAAFYYGWYPENWTQGGIYPATHYNPSAGFYSLDSNPQIIQDQIASMQYGNIQAGIATWWGQGSRTDNRVNALLAFAHGTTFCWTLYYEPALNATQAASDLSYIAAHYASDPNYLHVNGKPVLFVYSRAVATCTDVATWHSLNSGFYLNLQVFAGYRTCAGQPDSWHQYGPAVAEDHQSGYSFSISPGFNKYDEATPRLVRDPVRWAQNVTDMVNSHEPWQLITTFNEWMEGTSIESATEWQSASGQGVYMDALHATGFSMVTAAVSQLLAPSTVQPSPTPQGSAMNVAFAARIAFPRVLP